MKNETLEKIMYWIFVPLMAIAVFLIGYMRDYGESDIISIILAIVIGISFVLLIFVRTKLYQNKQTQEEKTRDKRRNLKIIKWAIIIFVLLVLISFIIPFFL